MHAPIVRKSARRGEKAVEDTKGPSLFDPYFDIVQVKVYGQARFFNPPPTEAPQNPAWPTRLPARRQPPQTLRPNPSSPKPSPPTPRPRLQSGTRQEGRHPAAGQEAAPAPDAKRLRSRRRGKRPLTLPSRARRKAKAPASAAKPATAPAPDAKTAPVPTKGSETKP